VKVIRPLLTRWITARVTSVIGAYFFTMTSLIEIPWINSALFMPPFGFFLGARSLIATCFAAFFGAHFAIGPSLVCTSPYAGQATVYAIFPYPCFLVGTCRGASMSGGDATPRRTASCRLDPRRNRRGPFVLCSRWGRHIMYWRKSIQ